jgi:hypothetical protein
VLQRSLQGPLSYADDDSLDEGDLQDLLLEVAGDGEDVIKAGGVIDAALVLDMMVEDEEVPDVPYEDLMAEADAREAAEAAAEAAAVKAAAEAVQKGEVPETWQPPPVLAQKRRSARQISAQAKLASLLYDNS